MKPEERRVAPIVPLAGSACIMKHFSPSLMLVFAVALSLCACAQQRTVPFEEAAFVPYARSGSGTVTGTAFLEITKGNTITAGDSKSVVKLLPANAYTDELVAKHYVTNMRIEPPDPRYRKYVRRTNPDPAGRFAFYHVPPGVYYVSCDLVWSTPSTYTDSNGAISASSDVITHWIYKKISVKSGRTVQVEDWGNQWL
jgi:hypothetical protein